MGDKDSSPSRKDTEVVGRRIVAQIIDNLILTISAVSVIFAFALLASILKQYQQLLSGLIAGIGLLSGVGILLFYEAGLEYYLKGQTLGKKAVGIKVVKDDGADIGISEAIIRNLPVVALLIPYFGLIAYPAALFSMAATDKRQRLFDQMADTVVVEE